MGPLAILRTIALGRAVLGLVALTRPEIPARPWVGRTDAASTGGHVLARALGARDLALGLGALGAMRPARRARAAGEWVAMGALADALDAAITVAAFRSLPRRGRWSVLVAAGGSAMVGGVSLRALSRS